MGPHVQKGAEYDDDHEYKEPECQKRVLRTSEREEHDLDRAEFMRSRISKQKKHQRDGNAQQKGTVITEWSEDAEQAKRAQD